MNYSTEQLEFFSEIRSGTSSLQLIAAAGSGKTTTCEHSLQHIPSPQSKLIAMMAFNKRIADELERRVPSFVQCGTFHKRALGPLSRSLPSRPKIDGDKIKAILKKNLKYSDFELYFKFVSRLVGFAKNAGIGTVIAEDTHEAWEQLVAHNGLQLESAQADPEFAISLARTTLAQSNQNLSIIDFDDMLYLAVLKDIKFDRCSYLYVDEAQDTNPLQVELIARMLSPHGGRLIAVGDPYQAIYGFRGADANAMDSMASRFSMKPLTLSTCYRCSKAVIAATQKMLESYPR